tara:strand:- start:309 stop:2726 length:2418 start_codon:yes stop_codon:yes gene_type:complete
MNDSNLFNLNKFRKIKNNSYNSKNNCLKNSHKYYQTNPKFKKFDQQYYTAGDFDDFDKYGFLQSMFYFSDIKNENKNKNKNKNFDYKLFKLYKNISFNSIENSFNYMFHKFKKGIFIVINNNKLRVFLPFSNFYYNNNWFTNIYFSNDEKKLIESSNFNKIQNELKNYTNEFMNKYPDQFKKYKINYNRKKWYANNCFFRNQFPDYEGDLNVNIFKNLIDELVKNRNIPDVQFFINYRDFPILKKDYTEPYNHIFNDENIKIEKEYQFKKLAPILSQCVTDKYADIPIPTTDDWLSASSKFFTDDCTNSYHKNTFNKININWESKKNICVFRGKATGCGITMETNMRLKASYLSTLNPDILNAGITDWNAKPKKYSGQPIKIINPRNFEFDVIEGINNIQKSDYKYILNIDGSVSAFRLGSELSYNSVVLLVDSPNKLWYSNLLIPDKHYISIKSDLSDLIDKIKWCIKNDKKCKNIAKNAMDFYKKYLTKEGIFNYLQTLFINIHNNINFKNPLDIKKSKKNIAIITLFRAEKNTNRDLQKKIFINIINKIFPNYFNYHIFIIEQSEDGNKFNIGKLKNIGFEIALKKDKFNHFIFTDIDMIPDYNLIPYYLKNPTEPIAIAYKGTRYNTSFNKKPFIGAVTSFSKKDFIKINGYPNNFWGWGGEDDSLLIRISENNSKLIYPKIGKVIDTEESNNSIQISTKNKIQIIKNRQESGKIEKLLNDTKYWKKNGLNNLKYNVISSNNINENTTQIKVDLLKDQDEKNYKFLFPKINNLSNTNFKKFKYNSKIILDKFYNKIKISLI